MSPGDEDEESGDERAEDLTRDAVKRGISPAELWAMPIHQLLFAYFKQPSESPQGALEIVTMQNQKRRRPFIPQWLMPQLRR